MNDEFWSRFARSGRVEDYLEYKKHEENLRASADEDNNEWLGYKGTDNRGE